MQYFQNTKTGNLYKDPHGSVGLSAIERWCKTIRGTSRITLLKLTSRPRTVKTDASIRKVKHQHDELRVFSCDKIAS